MKSSYGSDDGWEGNELTGQMMGVWGVKNSLNASSER